MSCTENAYIPELIFNVGVHVTIMFCILTAFFLVIVTKISRKAINNEFVSQVNKPLNDSLNDILKQNPQLIPVVSELKESKLFEHEDLTVKYNNDWQHITMYMTVGILLFLIIIYPIILRFTCGICLDVKKTLLMNVIIFLFIGLVEFTFFMFIARKYIPVKPSAMVTALNKDLKKLFSSN